MGREADTAYLVPLPYIFGSGHMTKMATMPIYGKNLKKSSTPEPQGQLH